MTYIPRRRLLTGVLVAALGIGLLARAFPLWAFLPLTLAIVLGYVWLESRRVRDRYQSVLEGIRKIHGDAVGDFGQVRAGEVDAAVYKSLKEVATALERKNFQLVEKNIQLLSIKEIGLTLVSSLDDGRKMPSVSGDPNDPATRAYRKPPQ